MKYRQYFSSRGIGLFLSYLLFSALALKAQTEEGITSSSLFHTQTQRNTHWLGYGGLLLRDEYLSPLNYGGFAVNYSFETVRMRPHQWLWHPIWSLSFGSTLNPGQNNHIYQVQLRGDLAYLKRFSLAQYGYLAFGPNLSLGSGALYSPRNGNNPATAKVDLSLGLGLDYSYRLPINRLPIALRLSMRTDLLGYRFSQEFGESYYELYYLEQAINKRIYAIHLGKAQTLRLLASVDVPIWDIGILSLGYQLDGSQWVLNHLQNKLLRQSALIGLTTYLYQFNKRSDLNRFVDKLTF